MKRMSNVLLVLACALFFVIFGIWIFAKPEQSFSEIENRVLEGFPAFSADMLISGEFSENVGLFFCDQFPKREFFTDIKAKFNLTLGKGENNGVLIGESGYLMLKPQYGDLVQYRKNLNHISAFCQKYSDAGIETKVFFAPHSTQVLRCFLSDNYSDEQMNKVWDMAMSSLPDASNVNDEISESASRGEYVWYKTDHHWSALGAYIAYKELAQELGLVPIEYDELEKEYVSGGFVGTTASKAGVLNVSPDDLFLLRYEGDVEYVTLNYDRNEVGRGIYDFDRLCEKDKYRIFMGGNFGHAGVYGEGKAEREKVMVIKDSFANSVVPFLAYNCDMEIYDLRYFEGKISEEIEEYKPDKILILYGVDTLVNDFSIALLER